MLVPMKKIISIDMASPGSDRSAEVILESKADGSIKIVDIVTNQKKINFLLRKFVDKMSFAKEVSFVAKMLM